MKKLRTRILGAALAVALAFSAGIDFSAVLGGISAFAEESTDQPIVIAPQEDINRDEELPAFEEPVYTAMFSFPAEMRGVYVTPTVDYAAENSTEAVADEVETLLDNAESKLRRKNCDMLVANSLRDKGAGFGTDTNIATLLFADGHREQPSIMSKADLADLILDRLLGMSRR